MSEGNGGRTRAPARSKRSPAGHSRRTTSITAAVESAIHTTVQLRSATDRQVRPAGAAVTGDSLVETAIPATDLPAADAEAEFDEAGRPIEPFPFPPIRLRRSGVYRAETPSFLFTEELRVDIDGLSPTMTISGTRSRLFRGSVTWIARVRRLSDGSYSGRINYRNGSASMMPYTRIRAVVSSGFLPRSRTATVTFNGSGQTQLVVDYTFRRSAFREVSFEYDTVGDATAVTSYDLASHPVRPAGLPATTLTLESGYARLGIQVTKSGGDSIIPIAAAGANTTWSDIEMHDAMQAHWSRWSNSPQWALWVLFARQHDSGTGLGGVMFDDIGPNHRQGTAIFSNSFISQAPAGEANPVAWVQRMRFWTAMHEIGHAFNLAHSWQKDLPQFGTSWIPLSNEPEARSYMNYPYNVAGGVDAFFGNFDFTFSEGELLFLRHAPARFVQQGNESWFTNHGFEEFRQASTSGFDLELRVHRAPVYEFMEPVVAELKLTNRTAAPLVVDGHTLEGPGLTLVTQRAQQDPVQWRPFQHKFWAPDPRVLQPGESIYHQLLVSVSGAGWAIDEPGSYRLYAAAQTGSTGEVALSAPLDIRVGVPATRDAENLAGEVFTEDVGRTLALGGSRVLTGANEILGEVVARMPESRIAVHAQAALGAPMASDGKVLVAEDGKEAVAVEPADPAAAQALLAGALGNLSAAADSLGHMGITDTVRGLSQVLADAGEEAARTELLTSSADLLAARGVLPGVVAELRNS